MNDKKTCIAVSNGAQPISLFEEQKIRRASKRIRKSLAAAVMWPVLREKLWRRKLASR